MKVNDREPNDPRAEREGGEKKGQNMDQGKRKGNESRGRKSNAKKEEVMQECLLDMNRKNEQGTRTG